MNNDEEVFIVNSGPTLFRLECLGIKDLVQLEKINHETLRKILSKERPMALLLRDGERVCVCVCVCERERDCVCV